MSLHYSIIIVLFFNVISFGQNLIKNSSFSDIILRTVSDTDYNYKLLPNNLSSVSNWYLPNYIDYDFDCDDPKEKYNYTWYYTSREKQRLLMKSKFTNAEQLVFDNLGFVALFIDNYRPVSVIQQRLSQPISSGKYCFKFKFKFYQYFKCDDSKIDFSFSSNNLKKYYKRDKSISTHSYRVPKELIQIQLHQPKTILDENTPWEQRCYIINLKGNEKFFSFGMLDMTAKFKFCTSKYFLDDIELYELNGTEHSCFCDSIQKNITHLYSRDFPLNKEISNDSLVMFKPQGSQPNIINKEAKLYLLQLISYLQRNRKINIKFIDYNQEH